MRARGLMARALLRRANVSVRDRLRLPDGLRAFAQGSYIVSLRWRGTAPYIYRRRPLMIKPLQPPCGRGNVFPLWWLAPPPCPVGSMSLDSRVAYSSPMNPVPLTPPQFGGAAKGKRLNGQARRLTSPHLEVLCRTSTGALWVLSHGAMSLQESIETYSSP